MPGPINCRFCRTVVCRADLVTVRTCQRCWHGWIDVEMRRLSALGRFLMRRELRLQREAESYRWEV